MIGLSCCCRGSEPPNPCKVSCFVCGGVDIDAAGVTVEDDNGTWELFPYTRDDDSVVWTAKYQPFWTAPVVTATWVPPVFEPVFIPGHNVCTVETKRVNYNYLVWCNGLGISAEIYVITRRCLDEETCYYGYEPNPSLPPDPLGYVGDSFPTVSEDTQCFSDRVELTKTFDGLYSDADCFEILGLQPPPSVNAKFTLRIKNTASPRECCSPCPIPEGALKIEWANAVTGDGSGDLPQVGINAWRSGCLDDDQLVFVFECAANGVNRLRVYYGEFACGLDSAAADFLDHDLDASCDPYAMEWTITAAANPDLYSLGYRSFRISKP